jgi:hypothetical protein
MRTIVSAALVFGLPMIASSTANATWDGYYERPAYYTAPRVYRYYDEPRVVRRYHYYYGPRYDRRYYRHDGWDD